MFRNFVALSGLSCSPGMLAGGPEILTKCPQSCGLRPPASGRQMKTCKPGAGSSHDKLQHGTAARFPVSPQPMEVSANLSSPGAVLGSSVGSADGARSPPGCSTASLVVIRVENRRESPLQDPVHPGFDRRAKRAAVKQDAKFLAGEPTCSVEVTRSENGVFAIHKRQLQVRMQRLLPLRRCRDQRSSLAAARPGSRLWIKVRDLETPTLSATRFHVATRLLQPMEAPDQRPNGPRRGGAGCDKLLEDHHVAVCHNSHVDTPRKRVHQSGNHGFAGDVGSLNVDGPLRMLKELEQRDGEWGTGRCGTLLPRERTELRVAVVSRREDERRQYPMKSGAMVGSA